MRPFVLVGQQYLADPTRSVGDVHPVWSYAHVPHGYTGDIIGGASSPTQFLFRPRFAVDPYSTGIAGTYLCSASTPPGAGAHGMCGANAADRALGRLGVAPSKGG